mmetsp:Transcript_41835/g.112057  ORF Transcript_41835/g.112057 Transcript_41835/m.112057 type:complete len:250 (+) Transcript_41835:319-1068(+)
MTRDAGSVLFCNRRWFCPSDPSDRHCLEQNFENLCLAHPQFKHCLPTTFMQTIQDVSSRLNMILCRIRTLQSSSVIPATSSSGDLNQSPDGLFVSQKNYSAAISAPGLSNGIQHHEISSQPQTYLMTSNTTRFPEGFPSLLSQEVSESRADQIRSSRDPQAQLLAFNSLGPSASVLPFVTTRATPTPFVDEASPYSSTLSSLALLLAARLSQHPQPTPQVSPVLQNAALSAMLGGLLPPPSFSGVFPFR